MLPRGLPWLALLGLALALSSHPHAHAQSAPSDRPSLEGERFDIDLVTGPVLGSGRIIGLAGAYTALAWDIAGAPINPAAFAGRSPHDLDWFEWDLTFDLVPTSIRNTDFDNNGESGFEYQDFLFLTVGGSVQLGAAGAGAVLSTQSYDVGESNQLELSQAHLGFGYAFADGQLIAGGGLRLVSFAITDTAGLALASAPNEDALVEFGGAAPELGGVLALHGLPFRVGVAARLPVVSDRAELPVAAGFTLPQRVRMPWELQAGLAWQLGPRPLNQRFVNPHDERDALEREIATRRRARIEEQARLERMQARLELSQQTAPPPLVGAQHPDAIDAPRDPEFWAQERKRELEEEHEIHARLAELADERERAVRGLSRRYLLITSDIFLIGAVSDGVGVESFLAQREQRSGRTVSVGARAGLEGEPIAGYVKMRAGSYIEPSRFAGVGYRVHGTLGFELRLFSWDLFGLLDELTLRLGASADIAERYANVGVGLGLWR